MTNKKGWDLLVRSIERQNSPGSRPTGKRTYSKPEKLVEADCLDWAKKNNCFFHVVESKGVYSQEADRFVAGQAENGYPDLSGNNSAGHSMWVELKAKDKRSNLSPGQYNFLLKKIEQGCFAVVVDSSERLNEFYYSWVGSKNKEAYLKSILPYPAALKKIDQNFDPSLGF